MNNNRSVLLAGMLVLLLMVAMPVGCSTVDAGNLLTVLNQDTATAAAERMPASDSPSRPTSCS